MKYPTIVALLAITISCAQSNQNTENKDNKEIEPKEVPAPSVVGVKESISGYSGGHTKNPTYEESNTGRTGHAEAVKIIYDPEKIDYKTLVDVYFNSQNVTQQNGQGPDRGAQYRSIIFYENDKQQKIIQQKVNSLQSQYDDPIAAEIKPFEKFWIAEDYHQDYKKKHPNNGYIQNVSNPRFKRFAEKMPELLKSNQ